MQPNLTIEEACQRYIHALLRAKERATNDEGFWKNGKAEKAYEQLCKAVDAQVETGLHWRHTIGELSFEFAESIWGPVQAGEDEDEIDEAWMAQSFTKTVLAHLEALKGHDWVASFPLEHRFNKFPPFTEFGAFCIVNPNGAAEPSDDPATPDNADALFDRFRTILADKLGIVFVEPDDVNTESYLNLADHYCNKSGGYIPGRPQMVIKVGTGDELVNKAVLADQVRYHVALMAICQIAYDLESEFFESRMSGWQRRLPDGEYMPDGLIAVPNVAVAIVERTGIARLWGIPQVIYETQYGNGYDPDKFGALWQDIAAPLLAIRNTVSNKVGDAIRSAVALVAKCRHDIMGDLLLNSVIATETLLNPFNKMGTSEGFAVFAARLTCDTVDDRLKTYANAKGLYNLRNLSVHRSWSSDEKTQSENRKSAFGLFRKSLKAVVAWVGKVVSEGGECNEERFREFHLHTLLT